MLYFYLVLRGRRRQARSVFDGFRDFQAEASKYRIIIFIVFVAISLSRHKHSHDALFARTKLVKKKSCLIR